MCFVVVVFDYCLFSPRCHKGKIQLYVKFITYYKLQGWLGSRVVSVWTQAQKGLAYDTIRYDTRCYFNVRSKADISQLNLPHGTDN